MNLTDFLPHSSKGNNNNGTKAKQKQKKESLLLLSVYETPRIALSTETDPSLCLTKVTLTTQSNGVAYMSNFHHSAPSRAICSIEDKQSHIGVSYFIPFQLRSPQIVFKYL